MLQQAFFAPLHKLDALVHGQLGLDGVCEFWSEPIKFLLDLLEFFRIKRFVELLVTKLGEKYLDQALVANSLLLAMLKNVSQFQGQILSFQLQMTDLGLMLLSLL